MACSGHRADGRNRRSRITAPPGWLLAASHSRTTKGASMYIRLPHWRRVGRAASHADGRPPVLRRHRVRLSRLGIVAGALTLPLVASAGVAAPAQAATSYQVTRTIRLGRASHPLAVAFDQRTRTAYVARATVAGMVSVIRMHSRGKSTAIRVGNTPVGIAADPVTGTVYVANESSNPPSVSVINEATGTVTGTIDVGSGPDAVAADPGTGTVYVANAGSSNVSVINEATGTVTGTIDVGSAPDAVAADPRTGT